MARIRALLDWVFRPEGLPAPASAPPAPLALRGPGWWGWLVARESLPEPPPRPGPPGDHGLLRWVLARERLPAAGPGVPSPSEPFATWLLRPEQLRVPEPDPEGGPE